MNKVTGSFTVYFDAPFWVGIFTREQEGILQSARIIFGSEPTAVEIRDFILEHHDELQFSPGIPVFTEERKSKPKKCLKRIEKELKKEIPEKKSHLALKQEKERKKQEKKAERKKTKDRERKERHEEKRLRRKEKHRGH